MNYYTRKKYRMLATIGSVVAVLCVAVLVTLAVLDWKEGHEKTAKFDVNAVSQYQDELPSADELIMLYSDTYLSTKTKPSEQFYTKRFFDYDSLRAYIEEDMDNWCGDDVMGSRFLRTGYENTTAIVIKSNQFINPGIAYVSHAFIDKDGNLRIALLSQAVNPMAEYNDDIENTPYTTCIVYVDTDILRETGSVVFEIERTDPNKLTGECE